MKTVNAYVQHSISTHCLAFHWLVLPQCRLTSMTASCQCPCQPRCFLCLCCPSCQPFSF